LPLRTGRQIDRVEVEVDPIGTDRIIGKDRIGSKQIWTEVDRRSFCLLCWRKAYAHVMMYVCVCVCVGGYIGLLLLSDRSGSKQ
jgi:hypothetical protein